MTKHSNVSDGQERRPAHVASGRIPLTYFTAALAALLPFFASAAARADDGGTIFTAKCSACHTIGKGKLAGPDLKGVTTTESHDFLVKWIQSPSAVLKSGDAHATALVKQYSMQMPDLGLSPADVDAVLVYIGAQSGAAGAGAKSAPAAAPALPPGDAEAGRALFTGAHGFQNGGPACMACHSISGIGALGGGTLGPDLTDAFSKYGGESGFASFLTSVPTPTMNAVWTKHPLAPQDIANVAAFVKEGAVSERPLGAIGKLAIMALVALVILVAIGATYWRRRLLGVRIPLVARANVDFNRKYAGRF